MTGTHFLVERLNWRRVNGTFYRLPGETRVAAFDTFDEAEAVRAAEEGRARAAVNPFAGGLAVPFDQTHWQPEVLCDYLFEKGIDPPPVVVGNRDWAGWWDREHPGWTADQRKAVWEPLDKVRFYRVREAPRRPLAYAVVQVCWDYNDEWMYPGAEGGEVQTLYRTREKAEAEAARRTAAARADWPVSNATAYDRYPFDPEQRLMPGCDPFGLPSQKPPRADEDDEVEGMWAADEVPFFEVVAVELEGVA